jgi:hypothetical protein
MENGKRTGIRTLIQSPISNLQSALEQTTDTLRSGDFRVLAHPPELALRFPLLKVNAPAHGVAEELLPALFKGDPQAPRGRTRRRTTCPIPNGPN